MSGKTLEELDMRAIFVMVSYNYDPKQLSLVVAGLEAEVERLRADLQGEHNVNQYLNRQNIEIAKEIGELRSKLAQALADLENERDTRKEQPGYGLLTSMYNATAEALCAARVENRQLRGELEALYEFRNRINTIADHYGAVGEAWGESLSGWVEKRIVEAEQLREALTRFSSIDLRYPTDEHKLVYDILNARKALEGEK